MVGMYTSLNVKNENVNPFGISEKPSTVAASRPHSKGFERHSRQLAQLMDGERRFAPHGGARDRTQGLRGTYGIQG